MESFTQLECQECVPDSSDTITAVPEEWDQLGFVEPTNEQAVIEEKVMPKTIDQWFSTLERAIGNEVVEADLLFSEFEFLTTDTKPDVGSYNVLKPKPYTNTRVTVITESLNDIFVGLESGNAYLLRNRKLTKRVNYAQMNGPIDHVQMDREQVYVVSGSWLRIYDKLEGKAYLEHNFEDRVIGFLNYKCVTVATENGRIISVDFDNTGLECQQILDLNQPMYYINPVIYQGIYEFMDREPIIVFYKNWFAMIDIYSNKRELMRKFEIPDILNKDGSGYNKMVVGYRYVYFCNRIHKHEEIIPYGESGEYSLIKYIAVEGLTSSNISGLRVKGEIIDMSFRYGLLFVSLTTRRVEVYNADTLLLHHVFLIFEMVSSIAMVDHVVIAGTVNGNIHNFRLGEHTLCPSCRFLLRSELKENLVVCYACIHGEKRETKSKRVTPR